MWLSLSLFLPHSLSVSLLAVSLTHSLSLSLVVSLSHICCLSQSLTRCHSYSLSRSLISFSPSLGLPPSNILRPRQADDEWGGTPVLQLEEILVLQDQECSGLRRSDTPVHLQFKEDPVLQYSDLKKVPHSVLQYSECARWASINTSLPMF